MKQSMTNQQQLSESQLDQLFAQAGVAESELMDDNFTKTVMNQLPACSITAPTKINQRRYLPEIIGFVVGLVITFLIVEPGDLLGKAMATVQQSLLISPAGIALAIGFLGALAYAAWWNMERNPKVWDF